jgi:hypothetical protein
MRIKCLFVEFHVFCSRVLEIRLRAALQRYRGYILLIAGLGIIQHGSVMLGIRTLWTVGVTTRRFARVAGAGDSKTAL